MSYINPNIPSFGRIPENPTPEGSLEAGALPPPTDFPRDLPTNWKDMQYYLKDRFRELMHLYWEGPHEAMVKKLQDIYASVYSLNHSPAGSIIYSRGEGGARTEVDTVTLELWMGGCWQKAKNGIPIERRELQDIGPELFKRDMQIKPFVGVPVFFVFGKDLLKL